MAHAGVYFDDGINSSAGPVARSQPEWLAVVGRLRGMRPAPADRARVLELGAGSGENLIPLALANRDSVFLGFDSSAQRVAMARHAARDLGLTNIEFRRQGILDIGTELGQFDYLIARDAYSSLAADERDRLLAVCRSHLAPQGLAYVGYKAYPGWHLHETLRALMLYDSRGALTGPQQRAAARAALEFFHASLASDDPFAQYARAELAGVLRQPDASLAHHYLGPVSHAAYFSEFLTHARSHALEQLGDGALGLRTVDDLGPAIEALLDGLTADPVQKEQCRDVFRNRLAREAVLCHANVPLDESPTPNLLQELYLASQLRPVDSQLNLHSGEVERFSSSGGLQISTAVPLIKAALGHLAAIAPSWIRLENLLVAAEGLLASQRAADTADPSPVTSAFETDRLKESLLLCCMAGVIDLHSQGPAFTTRVTSFPLASHLARWQLDHGDVATTLSHRWLRLDGFDRMLLRLLDGTRDIAQLVEQSAAWAAEGRLTIWEGQQAVQSLDRARQIFTILLPQSLARLAQNALLVA